MPATESVPTHLSTTSIAAAKRRDRRRRRRHSEDRPPDRLGAVVATPGMTVGRLHRRRCRLSSRTVIGIGAIGSKTSGTSESRHRRGEAEGEGTSSSRTMTITSVVGLGTEDGMGLRLRPDISIGAIGTRSILAVIAATTGPYAVTSTRRNARRTAATPGEVPSIRRHVATAVQCITTISRRRRRRRSSMTSAGENIAAAVTVTVTTADHLRHGWIVVEDGSSGVQEVDAVRSGEVEEEWIVAEAVVGTTRMTREGTTWTTTGSRKAIGKARGGSEVDRGHLTGGLRRGRGRASATGIGVVAVDLGWVHRRR